MVAAIGAQEVIVLLGLASSVTPTLIPYLPRLSLAAITAAWAVLYATTR